MEIDEELQPAAEPNAEQQSEAEGKPPVVDGESGAPEVVETDEQKNARVQQEATEKARLKEEKRQASVQRRMDELTADKYAERKRADELAAQNAKILALLEGKQNAPQAPGEPTREQFENYEDFVTARAEFRAVAKAEAAAQAAIEKFSKTQQETQSRSQQEESRKATEKQFIERRMEIEKSIPDYKEVMEDWEPKIPDSAVDLLVKMPDGPLITYHLAKNPSLEAQFRDQPAYMHGILLGQLSATLKSQAKVTAAPSPGKPIASKPGTSTEPPSDPNQYYAWAQKNLR